MSAGKTLNTGNTLYSNIVRALSNDVFLPKLIALDGGLDTASQPINFFTPIDEPTATWTANQGIARNSTNWFGISTASIVKYDLSNNVLVTNSSPFTGLPATLNHCGDGFADGIYLYVVVSNYFGGISTVVVIAKYLLTTLALDSFFDVSAQTDLNGSGCCLNPDGDEIFVTSFFDTAGSDQRNEDIYRFNKSTGAFLGITTLGTPSVGIQSITYHENQDVYYIGSHDSPNGENTIYIYDSSFVLITIIDPTGTNSEMEGVEYFGGIVYFNTVDDPLKVINLVASGMIISRTQADGDPIQFLDNVLMTDDVTILMKIRPLELFNFNSVMDNQSYSNDWESWIYGDGRLAWRVDASDNTIHNGINAQQEYIFAFTWNRDGGTANTKLGVDGVYTDSASGTWNTPPTNGMWLAGINGSNNQGAQSYKDILVFDKVLTDAELLSSFNNFDDFYIPDGGAISITGTAVPTQTEDELSGASGKTIILLLSGGDSFVTGTTSEDLIAGGSNSDQAASGTNWNATVKNALDNTDVVISTTTVTNDTATITLPTFGTYATPVTETIEWTIDAASLTISTSAIVATPTHTVTPVVSGRIMGSLANNGGLAGMGGLAGRGGGLAG